MNDIRFDGRVAIVTGAGNNIGRAVAMDLAARGAAVVVNDLGCDKNGYGSSRESADNVVREITAAGGKAVASYESVASRAGGAAIVQTALDAYGRVDIVVSNAGFLRNAPFEDITDEQLDGILDTHLKGAFYVCQPAYRVMKKQGYGRILLVCSASGLFGNPWQANYGAAKAGLAGLVHVLAIEGRQYGILANGLLPCAATRLGSDPREWPENWTAPAMDDLMAVAPTNTAETVTPMVTYLVSERCETTHGLYSAAGGRYARVFVGAADGWLAPEHTKARAEDISGHLAQIEDARVYHRPESVFDEFKPIAAAIRARG